MAQELGAETIEKFEAYPKWSVEIFQFVYAQEIAADCRFQFRISGLAVIFSSAA